MKSPTEIVQQYWGHKALRPAQETVIKALMEGHNVIALLPTGGGKSICFQVPSLLSEGICIVISPLIALMQDQVNALQKKGIKALMISGGISFQELDQLLDNCLYGGYKFLYLSPERLQQDLVQQRIQQMHVNFIAIDEAHCISEWGHDFRPSYTQLNLLRELHPKAPVIALTATATSHVVQDIQKQLDLADATIVKYSFQRKNIVFNTKKTEDKNWQLLQFLQQHKAVSIVYVRSRRATLELQQQLVQQDISARAYHGGIDAETKKNLLSDWLDEKFLVMVATSAFGMGIDKENVRNVIHFDLPESIENYFQEAGRAGRDQQEAQALLLYNEADKLRLENQFLNVLPTPENTKLVYKKLNAYFSVAFGEGGQSTHNFSFHDFCQTYDLPVQTTYNILQLLDRASILTFSKEFNQRTALRFTVNNHQLHRYIEKNRAIELLVKTLLRMQGGFFEYKHPVNIAQLSAKTGISSKEALSLLEKLAQEKIIDLDLVHQDTSLTFLVPREDDATINPILPYIKQQYQNKKQKIHAVIRYIENNHVCKEAQLLSYFGETSIAPCGKCSVCRAQAVKRPTKKELTQIYNAIVTQLKQQPHSSKELVAKLPYEEEKIIHLLQLMLDKNLISVSDNNIYTLVQ